MSDKIFVPSSPEEAASVLEERRKELEETHNTLIVAMQRNIRHVTAWQLELVKTSKKFHFGSQQDLINETLSTPEGKDAMDLLRSSELDKQVAWMHKDLAYLTLLSQAGVTEMKKCE